MKAGEKVDLKLLVKQTKKGNKESLIKLIMDQKDDYYKLAYIYMKSEADSMDALQDMIVIVYEKIGNLKKEESFYSWSKTILVNECKRKLRERKKIVSLDQVEEEAYEENYSLSEDRALLNKYLSKLSDKHEEVIRLHYLLDLDYESISQMLNIPLGTVKSRLSIGMGILRDMMRGEIDEGY